MSAVNRTVRGERFASERHDYAPVLTGTFRRVHGLVGFAQHGLRGRQRAAISVVPETNVDGLETVEIVNDYPEAGWVSPVEEGGVQRVL